MSYFLLLTSSFLFSCQFLITKQYEKTNGQSIRSSLFFSMISSLIASLLFFVVGGFRMNISIFSVLMALILSIINVTSIVIGIKAIKLGSVSIYSLFLMLGGMLIPYLVGIIFLNEKITIFNYIAILLMIISLVVPVFRKKTETNKSYKIFLVLCSFLFLLNGLNSSVSKLHQVNPNAVDTISFTVYYFAFQCILSTIMYVILIAINKVDETNIKYFSKKSVLCSSLFAIVNGTASLLLLFCAKNVPATSLYPLITGGTIVFSALLGLIVFKEKPTKVQIIQLLLSVISTFLFVFG